MSVSYKVGVREYIARNLARRASSWLARRNLRNWNHTQICCFPSDSIGMDVVAHGFYEDLYLRCLFEHAFRDNLTDFSRTVALDVGANIGNHTCWFAGLFSRVLAFEPMPLCVHMLKANLLINGFSNADVFQVALSDRDGMAALRVNKRGNLGASGVRQMGCDRGGREGGDFIDVEVRRGDELLRSAIDKSERISVIKLDIEGHERAALIGLKETIESHKPIVIFESFAAHGADGSHAILDMLADCGLGYVYVINQNFGRLSRLPRRILRLLSGFELQVVQVARPENRFHSMIIASAEPLESVHD